MIAACSGSSFRTFYFIRITMFETQPSTTLKPSKKPQQKYNWKPLALVAIGATFLLLVVLGFALDAFSESSNHLAKRIDTLQKENDRLALSNKLALERVNYYKVNKEYLKSIGATDNQADLVLKASTAYNIDPKIIGRLIRSESTWNSYVKHAHKNWKGLCGINEPVWREDCPYDPNAGDRGNIFAAAWIMSYYLNLSEGCYLDALHHYKSYTPRGLLYAKRVLYSN